MVGMEDTMRELGDTYSSPARARMDAARLDELTQALASRATTALLIMRHDQIVHEWYAPEAGPTKPHYTASLAKALVGGMSLLLAMSDGLVHPDDLASRYIPGWQDDPQRSQITLRQLATHTSGIVDAITPGMGHESQSGWRGRFWRGRSDPDLNPIEIALRDAPIGFTPGTDYAYSNPGMAALGYALTAALQDTPHKDLRSYLRARLMIPLGIADEAWEISYGRIYETDGLPVCATWGGGSYTARAVARVGQLMRHEGYWRGRQLVDAAVVRSALRYVGVPLPGRSMCNPAPASGLCWYTNFDGVWPTLPRDAFAGAGAEQQVLLVVPSRDLVVVRQGGALGEPGRDCFWGDLLEHLFTPVMDAFLDRVPEDAQRAPYPSSSVIREVTFDAPSTIVRKAFHSDNWPITWTDDDHQVTAYGDGRGFEPFTEGVLSLGLARIVGPAEGFRGLNLRSSSGERHGYGASGAKASGLLAADGVLYMWARNTGNAQLAWSEDRGRTWTWSDWRFETSFGAPTFLNYGRDYRGARDDYVYVYSHDADSAYEAADRMVLARVPRDAITRRAAYEFFVALDSEGTPEWSPRIEARGAVFEHPGYCRRSQISYNAAIGRYLWWQQAAGQDVDTRFEGGFGIYDAPEPWGPWTTAYFTTEWDTGAGEMGVFPTKWMSPDGRICYLVTSGFDCFSVRRTILSLD